MKIKKTASLCLLLLRAVGFSILKVAAAEFSKSYQEKLSVLNKQHPNWIFEPVNVDLDFFECAENQTGKKV